MATLDSITRFAERVERNAAKRQPIDWRRFMLAMLSAIPYMLGRVAGAVVYGVRIMAAATREGYIETSRSTVAVRHPLVAAMSAPSSVDS